MKKIQTQQQQMIIMQMTMPWSRIESTIRHQHQLKRPNIRLYDQSQAQHIFGRGTQKVDSSQPAFLDRLLSCLTRGGVKLRTARPVSINHSLRGSRLSLLLEVGMYGIFFYHHPKDYEIILVYGRVCVV